MIYEFYVASRTIKNEGVLKLIKKILIYFWSMALAFYFVWQKKSFKSAKKIVNFCWDQAYGLIRPHQIKSELLKLTQILFKIKPKVIIEIGTGSKGGTLFIFCSAADPQATIISIDLIGGKDGGGYAFWRTLLYHSFKKPNQKLYLIRGKSKDVKIISQVKSILNGQKADFLFIDGDHSLNGVKKDYQIYSPFVKKGGLIGFHDICHHDPKLDCHVDKYWNKIKVGEKYQEIVENYQQGWAGIGLIYK